MIKTTKTWFRRILAFALVALMVLGQMPGKEASAESVYTPPSETYTRTVVTKSAVKVSSTGCAIHWWGLNGGSVTGVGGAQTYFDSSGGYDNGEPSGGGWSLVSTTTSGSEVSLDTSADVNWSETYSAAFTTSGSVSWTGSDSDNYAWTVSDFASDGTVSGTSTGGGTLTITSGSVSSSLLTADEAWKYAWGSNIEATSSQSYSPTGTLISCTKTVTYKYEKGGGTEYYPPSVSATSYTKNVGDTVVSTYQGVSGSCHKHGGLTTGQSGQGGILETSLTGAIPNSGGKYTGIGVQRESYQATDHEDDTNSASRTVTVKTTGAPDIYAKFKAGEEAPDGTTDGSYVYTVGDGALHDGWTNKSIDVTVTSNNLPGNYYTAIRTDAGWWGYGSGEKADVTTALTSSSGTTGFSMTGKLVDTTKSVDLSPVTTPLIVKIDKIDPVPNFAITQNATTKDVTVVDSSSDTLSQYDSTKTKFAIVPAGSTPTDADYTHTAVDVPYATPGTMYDVYAWIWDYAGNDTQSNLTTIECYAGLFADKAANVTTARPGDTFTWYVQANNALTTPVTNGTITDEIPAGLDIVSISDGGTADANNKVTWTVSLPASSGGNPGTKVVSVTVKVQDYQDATTTPPTEWADGYQFKNKATITDGVITMTTPESVVEIDYDTEPKTITSTGSMDDGAGHDIYAVGDIISYKIVFSNEDPLDVNRDVSISDNIPAGTSYVDGTAKAYVNGAEVVGAGSYNAALNYLVWNIPSVATADTNCYVEFQVEVKEEAWGTIVPNEGVITVGDNLAIIKTNKTESQVESKKSKPVSGIVYPGAKITYTIGYEVPEGANKVVITDGGLTANASYIAGTAKLNGNGVTDAGADDEFELVGSTPTWTISGLTPGDKGTVSFQVKVDDNAAVGTHVNNRATVNYYLESPLGDVPVSGGDTNETDDEIEDAQKLVDKAEAVVGEVLTYTIIYKNTGATAATVKITDTVPTNTTFVDGSAQIDGAAPATGEFTKTGTNLVWNFQAPANTNGVVTFSVTVDETAYGVTVTNVAVISVGDSTPVVITSNPAVTAIHAKASKIENTKLYANGIIEYTLGYQIPAGTTADTVVLTDAIVAANHGTYVAGSMTDGTHSAAGAVVSKDDTGITNGLGTLTWTITGLTAGDQGYVTFKVKADDGLVAGDLVKNKGHITYYDGVADPGHTTPIGDDDTNEVTDTIDADSKEIVTVVPAKGFAVGDEVEYKIIYENTNSTPAGTSTATITILDVIPTGTAYLVGSATPTGTDITLDESGLGNNVGNGTNQLKWIVENVAEGATGSVTFKVKVLDSALGTTIVNQGEYKNVTPSLPDVDITTNPVKAKVGEKKSVVDNTVLFAGGTITYTIGYQIPETINGAAVANGDAVTITITDVIPANTTYIPGTATPTGGDVTLDETGISSGTGTLKWTIAGTADTTNGYKGRVTFQVKVDDGIAAGTTITNKASMTYDNTTQGQTEGPEDTNETKDDVQPDTKTTVTPPANGYQVGDFITYRIDYKNTNLSDSATITVTDVVPTGTTYVTGTAKAYDSSATEITAAAGSLAGGTVTWVIADVAPQDTGYVIFDVKVEDSALGTTIVNQGEYKFPGDDGSEVKIKTNEKKDKVGEKKSVVDNTVLFAGGTITYTIGYQIPEKINNVVVIDGDAVTITLTDVIPTNTTYIPGTATPTGGDVTLDETGITGSGTGTLKWTIAGTADTTNGYKGRVSFKVQVDDSVPAGTTISNKGSMTFNNTTQNQTEGPIDTNETKDDVQPDTKTTVAPPANGYQVGDIITYRIDYKNTNVTDTATITVTDAVPTGTTYVTGSAKAYDSSAAEITTAAGSLAGGTVTWVIADVVAQDTGYVIFDVKVDDSALGTTIVNQGEYKFPGDDGSEVKIKTNEKKDKVGEKKSVVDNTVLFAGGTITYTIGYQIPEKINNVVVIDGDAVTITLTDVIPTNTTYIPGTATPTGGDVTLDETGITGSGTGTLKWTITGTADTTNGYKGRVSFKVQVDDSVPAGTTISNKGSMTFNNTTQNQTEGPKDTNETQDDVKPDTKTTVAPPANGYQVGDVITYRIDYMNSNAANSATITVTDVVPTGTTYVTGSAKAYDSSAAEITAAAGSLVGGTVTWVIADVAPQDDGYVIFKVKVDDSALGTTIVNQGEYKFPGDDGSEVKIKTNEKKDKVGEKKSVIDNGKLFAGGTITYTVGYEIPSKINNVVVVDGDAVTITITDAIPANAVYVAGTATPTGGDVTLDETGITAGVGTLKWVITGTADTTNGYKGRVSFQVRVNDGVPAGTPITNQAAITLNNTTQNTTEGPTNTNQVIDPVDPDNKTTSITGSVGVGEKIPYWIEFENEGTDPAKVVITDVIPTGTRYVANSAKVFKQDGTTDWDTNDGTFTASFDGTKVTWTGIDVLPNAVGKAYFEVVVTKDALSQIIKNQGKIEIGEGASKVTINTNEVKTPTDEQKASEVNSGNGVLTPSGQITYTIGYYNSDPSNPQDITITDVIPANTTYLQGTATNTGLDVTGITAGTGTIQWVIPNVAPGAGGTVSFRVMVDSQATSGTEIENEAQIQVGSNAPITSNKTIDIVNPKKSQVTHQPGSTAAAGVLEEGDTIDYTIKYANSSAKPQNIVITDKVPTGTELNSMPAGAVGYDENDAATAVLADVVKLSWTISNVPAATTGTVTFQVTVTAKGGAAINTGIVTVGTRDPQVTNTVVDAFPGGGGGKDLIVYFDSCGGNYNPTEQHVPYAGYATYPLPDPVKDGYTFLGWYVTPVTAFVSSSQGADGLWEFASDQVIATMTLYARWQKDPKKPKPEEEKPEPEAPSKKPSGNAGNQNGGSPATADAMKPVSTLLLMVTALVGAVWILLKKRNKTTK